MSKFCQKKKTNFLRKVDTLQKSICVYLIYDENAFVYGSNTINSWKSQKMYQQANNKVVRDAVIYVLAEFVR